MHISASKLVAINENDFDKSLLIKEREIFLEQLSNSETKEILEKIIHGKIKKFISEITLMNQNWILDPNNKVSDIIENLNKKFNSDFVIEGYKLFVLGEGIDASTKDFKEEVEAQLTNNS